MMKKIVLISLAVAVLAAILPAAGLAKGASEAAIDGPGLSDPIVLKGVWNQLGQIAEASGFFAATFGRSPDPMLTERPEGDLGPRYTITYVMPGPDRALDRIVQDVYPYATPEPVTHTASGQSFFGTEETRGGWFVAASSLKGSLVEAGLPANAPAGGEDGGIPATLVGVLAALIGGLVVLLIAARRVRRRPRTATA